MISAGRHCASVRAFFCTYVTNDNLWSVDLLVICGRISLIRCSPSGCLRAFLQSSLRYSSVSCRRRHCEVSGGDTECPLQVCQLSRSSESTHFLLLRRDVDLFDCTRAPDSFSDRRIVPLIHFLTVPNIKRQPYHTKLIQMISNSDIHRPFVAVS